MIKVECFPLGELQANCYFVYDREQKTGLLIDPGDRSKQLEDRIRLMIGNGLQYILLTHGHFDHIDGVASMKRAFPEAKIVIGTPDADYPALQELNLAEHFGWNIEPFTADITVNDNDTLPFGTQEILVLSTPGHTKGSVCYRLGEDFLFTGDTLISGTTGRTDFPTGSPVEMYHSIVRLAQLEGNPIVYSGHGKASTLENERRTNLFIRKYVYDDIY